MTTSPAPNVQLQKESQSEKIEFGRSITESLNQKPPIFSGPLVTLSKLNMLDMLHTVEQVSSYIPILLEKLDDPSLPAYNSLGPKSRSRVRAALKSVPLKGLDPSKAQESIKGLNTELDNAQVAIWERVDIAQYLGDTVSQFRKETLDTLAKEIDSKITKIHDVEILQPSKEKEGKLGKDLKEVAKAREEILRLVHDYMRLVDEELSSPACNNRDERKKEKARFDHFKMMRESEELSELMFSTTDPKKFEEYKARKYQIDKLLETPEFGLRSAVGTNGRVPDEDEEHKGKIFVVYEDYIKVGKGDESFGSPAWLNNNPANISGGGSPLATNKRNKYTNLPFCIFPSMELGFQAIPLELQRWRSENPSYYTILNACKRWANLPQDNPEDYASVLASKLNAGNVKVKGSKITSETLLADLTNKDIQLMGEKMALAVERIIPGTIYYRSDVGRKPWIAKHLG